MKMERSVTPILKIKLTPSLREAARVWVDRFNREQLAKSADPVLDGDILHIDSYDLGNLLRLVSTAEASALDVHRLRHLARKMIQTSIARSRSRYTLNSLEFALTMLDESETGEWKDGVPRTDRKARIGQFSQV